MFFIKMCQAPFFSARERGFYGASVIIVFEVLLGLLFAPLPEWFL